MSKVLAVVRWIVRESLITAGLLAVGVVIVVWWGLSNDGDLKGRKAAQGGPVAGAVAVAPGVAQAVAVAPEVVLVEKAASAGSDAAAGSGCECSGGAVCTGPRGGKFCIDASGVKRYK